MTTIILSSSPPPLFARSPTSVESSPSLRLLSGGSSQDGNPRKRFKTSNKRRDGLMCSFASPRPALGSKRGAENVSLGSPGKERFKTLNPEGGRSPSRFLLSDEKHEIHKSLARTSKIAAVALIHNVGSQGPRIEEREQTPGHLKPLSNEYRQTGDQGHPIQISDMEIATARRTDWTPVKEQPLDLTEVYDLTSSPPGASSISMLKKFGFDETSQLQVQSLQSKSETTFIKGKRIDLVGTTTVCVPPAINKSMKPPVKPSTTNKKSKQPPKKAKTITNLATSHYFGAGETSKDSPMAQFLTATQAVTADDSRASVVDGDLQVKVRSKAPLKGKKPRCKKSTLKSPQSAIKILQEQDTVFGSASQLFGDDDELVELDLSSDPVLTQRSYAFSIESRSPQTARPTSRFTQCRNLWGAGDRDQDNALLHVDTVDLFDSPSVRTAFAGKDVLLQPSRTRTSEAGYGPVTDVDFFASPAIRSKPTKQPSFARSLHTSHGPSEPDMTTRVERSIETTRSDLEAGTTASIVAGPVPQRPSYTGFTISQLQKQITAYGFKPVKKREKMIELLNQCWDQKYGHQVSAADPQSSQNMPTHGDFLSKVHDFASRPVPKVAKPRKGTKSAVDGASPKKEAKRRRKSEMTQENEQLGMSPKPKKPRTTILPVSGDASAPKKPRKKTGKPSALSSEYVYDIDGESHNTEFQVVQEPNKEPQNQLRLPEKLTPPPTFPTAITSATERPILPVTGFDPTTLSLPDTQPGIDEQIEAAIKHQSEEAAQDINLNHQINPTWHEKLLMYDPIVLEDFTSWLNTEGFAKINEDREVGAIQVRAWCEGRGICCLWKGGWRGQKGKTTDD